MQGHYNTLFLCTGNSARSIMAEAILNSKGRPNFTAYSAGSHPSGKVRPEALRQLEMGICQPMVCAAKRGMNFLCQAPQARLCFTVCDNAAKEVCPIWPGQPMTAIGASHPARFTEPKRKWNGRFARRFYFGAQNQSVALPSTEDSRQPCTQEELDNIGQTMALSPRIGMGFNNEATFVAVPHYRDHR